MLKVLKTFSELNIWQLRSVYGDLSRSSFDSLCDYLEDVFFRQHGAGYAVLLVDDVYVSAARIEPYEDGFLLSGLQTCFDHRNKGYAVKLLAEVVAYLKRQGGGPIYSHVQKSNRISLKAHCNCGFCDHLDYAHLLDGTVSANYLTLIYQ